MLKLEQQEDANSVVNRRQFLKVLAEGSAATLLAFLTADQQRTASVADQFQAVIDHYTVRPELATATSASTNLKAKLRPGLGLNLVYGFASPDWASIFSQVEESQVSHVRLFFDVPELFFKGMDYETSLGEYQPQVLERFQEFCLPLLKRHLQLILVLTDGYRIAAYKKSNPVYSSRPVASIYAPLMAQADAWTELLSSPSLLQALLRRQQSILTALQPLNHDYQGQIIIEPFNEAEPGTTARGPQLLATFLNTLQYQVQQMGFLTLSGVDNPSLVRTGKTLHLYPGKNNQVLPWDWLEVWRQGGTLLEETGIPSRMFERPIDQNLLANTLLQWLFLAMWKIDNHQKQLTPVALPNLTWWHGVKTHNDGYYVGPELPQFWQTWLQVAHFLQANLPAPQQRRL